MGDVGPASGTWPAPGSPGAAPRDGGGAHGGPPLPSEPARSHLGDRSHLGEMRRAHALKRAQRHDEAAEAFLAAAQAAGQGQEERDALLLRAVSLKAVGDTEAADAVYRHTLARYPSDAGGWGLYGTFLRGAGRHDEAIAALCRSLEIKDDMATRNALVVAYYLAGRMDKAVAEGLRSLRQKDEMALARHDGSGRLRLPEGAARSFNPKTRQRNVISFSLWGSNPVYVHGAIVNARIAPHIYYGWTTRFYCDRSVPADAMAELRREGAQVVLLEDPALQAIRPMWRFLASDDPQVDWFICRDADSRLNCQELIAVEEWLRSGRPFHVMRDHIYHIYPILAGLWGGRAGVLPNLKEKLLSAPEYFNDRFGDQNFLMYEIWPLVRDHVFTHDTHYRFLGGQEFPQAYRLPDPLHVGGAVKLMPDWRRPASKNLRGNQE